MSICVVCNAKFATYAGLDPHANDCHGEMSFSTVAKLFQDLNMTIPESVARHVDVVINCNNCGKTFSTINHQKREAESDLFNNGM